MVEQQVGHPEEFRRRWARGGRGFRVNHNGVHIGLGGLADHSLADYSLQRHLDDSNLHLLNGWVGCTRQMCESSHSEAIGAKELVPIRVQSGPFSAALIPPCLGLVHLPQALPEALAGFSPSQYKLNNLTEISFYLCFRLNTAAIDFV